MLKKKNRISVFKKNIKSQDIDTPLFKIKIFPNDGKENKFGFIISKKIDKRAVVRNRTKRLLSKVARSFLGRIEKGKDIILISKKPLENKDEKEVREALEGAFKKTKIL